MPTANFLLRIFHICKFGRTFNQLLCDYIVLFEGIIAEFNRYMDTPLDADDARLFNPMEWKRHQAKYPNLSSVQGYFLFLSAVKEKNPFSSFICTPSTICNRSFLSSQTYHTLIITKTPLPPYHHQFNTKTETPDVTILPTLQTPEPAPQPCQP